MGTTLAGWVNLALLWRGTRRFGAEIAVDERLAHRWPRILAASLVMGAIILGLAEAQVAYAPDWRVAGLIVIVALGALSFAAAALALGAVRPGDLRAALRRTPPDR